ncbi:MAG TPA: amino acid adenylation domain-containing protein, partial [Candidatus Deferrimicrobium sp.]|nr:amino acid adenylation domain-containing protein [Candidatus Deferrimicrobium sp.]
KDQINILEMVPSYLSVLLDYIRESEILPLALDYLLLTGEEVKPFLIKKWFAQFPAIKLVNAYGPTEASDDITHYIMDKAPDMERIPIGKPVQNLDIYIVDNNMQLCLIGVKGEICVSGVGVGRGYLGDEEKTKQVFMEDPFREEKGIRLYKTGDLGSWLPDGNIEFYGRKDQQVKIRGFRIELEEIENKLLNHHQIKDVVVAAKEDKVGNKYLCAYLVGHSTVLPGFSELKEYLAGSLPDYMIPAYFVQLEKIPLTPNGKVDRKALLTPELKTGEGYVAPRTGIEKKLAALWSEVLGRDALHASQLQTTLGIDDNFFNLGGHSLRATVLASRIHKELDVVLPLAELFKTPTIRGLADYIMTRSKDIYESIMPVEKREYYVLSFAQKRMYILQQIELNSTAYNMPQIIPLPGEVDNERIKEAFSRLIKRHDSLRTSFHMIDEQPMQRIHEKVDLEIEYYNLSTNYKDETSNEIHHFVRTFDLTQAPLLRVGFVKTTGGKQYLLVDMHHIISDGISHQVLREDFTALYEGKELPILWLQYKDFSQWQNEKKEKERFTYQEEYWLKEFAGELPVLDLPADYPRPLMQSFEGNSLVFEIPVADTQGLKTMAQQEGATLFMVLAAVLNILLAKLSGHEDIIIGVPVAGRRHVDLEKIIGMFVNTLALRNYPSGEKSFPGFLNELKNRTLDAFENQDYQFEDLVEKVVTNRDMSRNPLFDVMFMVENINRIQNESLAEPLSNQEEDGDMIKIAKFDLEINAWEAGPILNVMFNYCTKLFKKETVERFGIYFKKIAATFAQGPDIKIGDIEIISAEERKQILNDFNRTGILYPKDKTIQQLFTGQVEKSPDHIALIGPVQPVQPVQPVRHFNLTYRQVEEQSDQVANLLVNKGVLAEDIIGIMMEHSIEMITGMLGILKSGGAYLPLDPDYPPERIDYILKDSAARLLLTANNMVFNSQHSSFIIHHSNRLAYVIYTFGSTGKPKGVMVEHCNVGRLVKNTGYIHFSARDRLLPTGSSALDITAFEMWGPLCNGAGLTLAAKETILNTGALKEVLLKQGITVLHLKPLLFNQLAAHEIELFAGLRYLLVGGDRVSPVYMNTLRQKYGHLKILHMYGPTENTTFCTFFPVEQDYEFNIPIGKPVANTTAYIVDKYGHLQPLGVMGELCVGGAGVARGYLNNPELTSARFKQDLSDYLDNQDEKNKSFSGGFYKTGDLARWLPGGNIEFLGRIHQQIKIRGFRVELREIENRLLNYPGLKEAVVLAEAENEDQYLCAYIVSDREHEAAEWREYLAHQLPEYMIPSYFVQIEKIPITA